MLIYKLAALVELSLVILEDSGYVHLSGLPLGGGQIQQIGIVFATAYVIAEFIEIFSRLLARYRSRRSKGASRATG
jgi:hypothetical protein